MTHISFRGGGGTPPYHMCHSGLRMLPCPVDDLQSFGVGQFAVARGDGESSPTGLPVQLAGSGQARDLERTRLQRLVAVSLGGPGDDVALAGDRRLAVAGSDNEGCAVRSGGPPACELQDPFDGAVRQARDVIAPIPAARVAIQPDGGRNRGVDLRSVRAEPDLQVGELRQLEDALLERQEPVVEPEQPVRAAPAGPAHRLGLAPDQSLDGRHPFRPVDLEVDDATIEPEAHPDSCARMGPEGRDKIGCSRSPPPPFPADRLLARRDPRAASGLDLDARRIKDDRPESPLEQLQGNLARGFAEGLGDPEKTVYH